MGGILSGQKKPKKYIAIDGETVILDISNKALGKYKTIEGKPLKHNMPVRINSLKCNATIIGVGRPDENRSEKIVFWILEGRTAVSYGYPFRKDDISSVPE